VVCAFTAVETDWALTDWLGALSVRLDIGRMNYRVSPGLYSVGHPDATAPVFVTANYKLSFDHLRRALRGLGAWLLVLDTDGVNVWCAAGKGTFSTEELCRRIESTGLGSVVSHRRLILPQLGASGVAAHTVAKATGFTVVFGPVRAEDIPARYRSRESAGVCSAKSGQRIGVACRDLSFPSGGMKRGERGECGAMRSPLDVCEPVGYDGRR
jgi:hypothetical protein